MRHALALGQRGIGRTASNPSVGCVLVSSEGIVVGRGRTGDGGIPHGEAAALVQAGSAARGATAYVTLEPCATVTRTPSCAQSLIEAGVIRVVASMEDPHHLTSGRGFAKLRAAGVEVEVGLLEEEARLAHAGFLMRLSKNRPLVTLKIAQSQDHKTATTPGRDKWITGEEARRFGHLLRARNQAILVGINTVLSDDPELTCRLPGLEAYSPTRVVLDSKLRMSETSKLATSASKLPTIVVTSSSTGGEALRRRGVEIVQVVHDANGRPDLEVLLTELAKKRITRLLVEGGATIHSSFLARGLADRLEIFTSPTILGPSGHGVVSDLEALTLHGGSRFNRVMQRKLGNDLLESFAAKA